MVIFFVQKKGQRKQSDVYAGYCRVHFLTKKTVKITRIMGQPINRVKKIHGLW